MKQRTSTNYLPTSCIVERNDWCKDNVNHFWTIFKLCAPLPGCVKRCSFSVDTAITLNYWDILGNVYLQVDKNMWSKYNAIFTILWITSKNKFLFIIFSKYLWNIKQENLNKQFSRHFIPLKILYISDYFLF